MNKFSEQEQRSLFIQSFNQEESNLYCEIPVFCRSVDLVRHDKIEQTISAIEFKTTNWKRAIEQVLEVSISFDFLEICIFEPKTVKAKSQIIDSCNNLGIGLYFFNQDLATFSHNVESQKVINAWGLQKQRVMSFIREVDANDRQPFTTT